MTRSRFIHQATATAFAVAVCLLGSLPGAQAQESRLSLSERVTRLEQQAAQDKGNIGLVNEIQALKAQSRQLQGQIEELQHQLQQLQDSSKDQYVDLDSRLRRIETGSTGANVPAAAPADAASSVAPPHVLPTPADDSAVNRVESAVDAPAADAGKAAIQQQQQQQAQTDYDAAFKALRAGDFVASAHGFRDFIGRYPGNALLPNAYYWLGESYYITQNYPVALQTFQKLLQLYPDDAKSSGALLKVGYCQYELKQLDQATDTLNTVIAKYPGSDVAKLAKRRLQDIQLQTMN